MELGLKDRVAIVAAASQGLGRAAAAGLAAEGTKVVIFARHKKDVQAAAREISESTKSEVIPVIADVTKTDDIERVVETTVGRFGRVDILVNNAGGPPVAQFMELSDEQWLDGVALTLMSVVRLTREVIPYMRRQHWGRIITITSLAAKQPISDLVVSSTLRPGILGFAKVLATELAKDNILVNNVAPGFFLTKRQEELLRSRSASQNMTIEQYVVEQTRNIPIGRFGTPEELANVIVFLASEKASYVTGATVSVDGGVIRGIL